MTHLRALVLTVPPKAFANSSGFALKPWGSVLFNQFASLEESVGKSRCYYRRLEYKL